VHIKILTVAVIASVIFSVLSSLCWWRSSTVAVPHAHAKGSGTFFDGSVAIDGNDLYNTYREQARWNRNAAVLASLSVLFQAVSLYQTLN
jgi:hypothetical protein